jgi:hypothetical protein
VFLVLVFLMVTAVLAVLFVVGTIFIQSYVFTEPATGLAWRAPVAALVMGLFFTFWCFIVTRSDAKPGDIPYNDIFHFSPIVNMFPKDKPADTLWVHRTDGKVIAYKRKRDFDGIKALDRYMDGKDPYRPTGVKSIELEDPEKQKLRFDFVPGKDGDQDHFKNDQGWVMKLSGDPTGNPVQFRWGLLFANLMLNMLHGVLWFVCLWLVLRFTPGYAALFAAILWALVTIALLPMLLDQAAQVAQSRATTEAVSRLPSLTRPLACSGRSETCPT